MDEGRVYLQVTAGSSGDRDFALPSPPVPPTRIAFTQAAALIDDPRAETGLRIVLRPDLRWELRAAKTTQLLYAVLMKEEARAAGVDDAWLVEDGMSPRRPARTRISSMRAACWFRIRSITACCRA